MYQPHRGVTLGEHPPQLLRPRRPRRAAHDVVLLLFQRGDKAGRDTGDALTSGVIWGQQQRPIVGEDLLVSRDPISN
jgi:hypothetical protein